MRSVTRTFARSYQAVPETVGRARAELADFASGAGVSPTLVDGVRLAVSEAVTNAVRHAYPFDSGDGEIRVRARAEDDVLEVVVSDDGCGVHRERTSGGGLGFGLALICEISDRMTLAPRSDGGTDVRMQFALVESGSSAAVCRV